MARFAIVTSTGKRPSGNQQTRSSRTLPFGRKPERNLERVLISATLNVRGLSLPDQTRVACGAILIGCSYLFIARW
jgi:hypothetical protein